MDEESKINQRQEKEGAVKNKDRQNGMKKGVEQGVGVAEIFGVNSLVDPLDALWALQAEEVVAIDIQRKMIA